MKVEINIEKRHVYLLALIISISFIALIYAQSSSNNVDTNQPYHLLQQIAKGPGANDLEKVDKDNDGVIDNATYAKQAGDSHKLGGLSTNSWQRQIIDSCDFAIKSIHDDGSVECATAPTSTGGSGVLTGKIKEGYIYMHHVRKPSYTVNVGFAPSEVRFDLTLYNCGIQNSLMRARIGQQNLTEIEGCFGGFCGIGYAGPLRCIEETRVPGTDGDTVPADKESQKIEMSKTLYPGLKCNYRARAYPLFVNPNTGLTQIEGVCFGDESTYDGYSLLMGKAQISGNGFSIEFQDNGWGGAPILVHYIARG